MIVYAIYARQAEADDELSFALGDTIEVIEDPRLTDCWCQGRHTSSFKEGLFPVNYVATKGPSESSGSVSETNTDEYEQPLNEADYEELYGCDKVMALFCCYFLN